MPHEVSGPFSLRGKCPRDQWSQRNGVAFMAHGIGGDDAAAQRRELLIGVLSEDGMHDGHHGWREALLGQLSGRFDQRVTGGGNVIDQYGLSAAPSR